MEKRKEAMVMVKVGEEGKIWWRSGDESVKLYLALSLSFQKNEGRRKGNSNAFGGVRLSRGGGWKPPVVCLARVAEHRRSVGGHLHCTFGLLVLLVQDGVIKSRLLLAVWM